MKRVMMVLGTLVIAGTASACDEFNATFENESTRTVLTILAKEAGLKLMNPEIVTGNIDATFEHENAARLLTAVAGGEGYELRIRGGEVWLAKI